MNKPVQPKEPLVTHIYTADPSAHVFEGKIYIYPSHDLDHDGPSNDNGDQYAMEDYHILSMDDINSPCVDHGEALHLRDIPWAKQQLWAPDAAFKNNTYYLFSQLGTKRIFSDLVSLQAQILLVLLRLKKIISLAATVLILLCSSTRTTKLIFTLADFGEASWRNGRQAHSFLMLRGQQRMNQLWDQEWQF